MNVDSSSINQTSKVQTKTTSTSSKSSSVKFEDELKELQEIKTDDLKSTDTEKKEDVNEPEDANKPEDVNEAEDSNKPEDTNELEDVDKTEVVDKEVMKETTKPENDTKDLDKSLEELNFIVEKFNQSDEKFFDELKEDDKLTDNNKKGEILINNDFNIQDNKDLLPQMNPNMNFSGDGQPFSSFMENENNTQDSNGVLNSSASDLAEEAAILSTMTENIAMANKNTPVQETEEKVVNREEGIKKVDVKSGITIEKVVKYNSVIMNEADVEVFASLAETGEANLNNLAPEAAQKSVQVSKTLADMLAKAKETQQPLRIDFDNGISVIIKISRNGKVSADFLPSTQVAETYLKENLPLLKQRFDEKNLEYEELNRRERRGQQKEDNRKKGRSDE